MPTGKVLSTIKRKALYRGASELGKFNMNPLRAGITLQFRDVGVLDDLSINDLIGKMVEKQAKTIKSKKNGYEPTKKLNDAKISLTYMEWYMKTRKSKGGYYDSYKNADKSNNEIEGQQLILRHQRSLNQYWKNFVKQKDLMPQTEGPKLLIRWLYAGNNYRRIIEPLDIAEYYKKCNNNYMENRPNHYKLLESWLIEDENQNPRDRRKSKAASLTEDSYFWAHVEEALISLRDLKNGDSGHNTANIEQGLIDFKKKLMGEINDFLVSQDIFLEGSSLMKWWSEYKAYKGSSYASEFAQYMNNGIYRSYI